MTNKLQLSQKSATTMKKLPFFNSTIVPALILALLISSTHASTSAASSGTNSSSVTEEIGKFLDDASDTFTDFIYSFSDAFLVGVGSSDRIEGLNVTELMSAFQPGPGVQSVNPVDYLREHWKDVVYAKIGLFVCIIVGILFVVFMPFVGFFFCCCRCCGNCGGRRIGKKHGGGKKAFCHFALFLFAIILTLFVMGSFIVAQRLNGNVKSIVTSANDNVVVKAVSTARPAVGRVLEDLEVEVKSTLKGLVDEIVEEFEKSGRELSVDVGKELDKAKIADKLEEIEGLLRSFYKIGEKLNTLVNESEKVGQTSLQSAVTSVIQTLENCKPTIKGDCDDLKNKIQELNADEALKKLPTKRLKDAKKTIEDLKKKDLNAKLEEGREMLGKIVGKIDGKVKKYKGLVVNVTKDLEGKVSEYVDNIQNQADQQLEKLNGQAENVIGQLGSAEQTITSFVDYATYAMFGISAAAGLAVLCLLTAFLAGCCSSKTSADCFMAFTGFYFIFCPLLMLLTLVFYNSLGQIQVEGCLPLLHPQPENPMADQILRQVSSTMGMEIELDVSNILYDCSEGKSIYSIVKSTGLFDAQLDEFLKVLDADALFHQVNESISDVKKSIVDSLDDSLKLIDVEAYTKPLLEALNDTDLDAVFSDVSSAVNITAIKAELSTANLTELVKGLNRLEEAARAKGETTTANELKQSADKFQKLEDGGNLEKEVFPLLDTIGKTIAELMNKKDIVSKARSIVKRLSDAISSLGTAMKSVILKIISEFTDDVFESVEDSIKKFKGRLSPDSEKPIASCSPVWKVVTTVVGVPCRLLVDPLNGYWFEIGGFLGVGFLAIIIAVKVAGVLRDEIQADEDEDTVFDVRNNHVTDHVTSPTKNQVGIVKPDKYGRGGGGGPDPRNQDNIAIEMRERNRYHPQTQPPPYDGDGTYRSTDDIYRDYRDKNGDYRDGHVNNGYRF